MSLRLGIDTGGTYTDAVLMRGEEAVIARAKALTTRQDLALGVGAAVRAVLKEAGVPGRDIGMAALSTTLATNALVEGQGGRAGLIYVGFDRPPQDTPGLAEALGTDPVCLLAGGHLHDGQEAAALDEAALHRFLAAQGGTVEAFAVAAQFATRNPAHEERIAALVRDRTGRPVSASHHLSARLGGPKRALTALLNARLIGMIDALIARAGTVLAELGITAPLMVVRGDGALMSAAQARVRPIETILSGPAASVLGARWLTGAETAMVSDIGGTTTDVALLRAGRPAIDPLGAQVGPHRTMVEAVAMRTTGLGGDSEVSEAQGLAGGITLGPRRVVPVSLLATEAPGAVLPVLEAQMAALVQGAQDGRFVRALPGAVAEGRAADVLARIGDAVRPLADVIRVRLDHSALAHLMARGAVQVAALTPSDAAHVLGHTDQWDAEAARLACALMARRRTGAGEALATDAEAMARKIVDQMTRQTALVLLEGALAEDGMDPALAGHALMQRGLERHRGAARIETGLHVPVIGLGAPARTYYPAVGRRLGCEMILPEDGAVANAIGAVVGQIVLRRVATITRPAEGRFRAHLSGGPEDFASEASALARAEAALRQEAEAAARAEGAEAVHLSVQCAARRAEIGAEGDALIEATMTVEATGRPRVASG